MIAHARVLFMIERGCYALYFFPECARGPRHLVTRPGPLPASRFPLPASRFPACSIRGAFTVLENMCSKTAEFDVPCGWQAMA